MDLSGKLVNGPEFPVSQSPGTVSPVDSGGRAAWVSDDSPGVDSAGTDLMLVDDDPYFRGAFASRLERAGYRVEELGDAERALIRLEESCRGASPRPMPAALVLDCRLDGMQGSELVDELCRREIDLPVVLLSGVVDPREARLPGVPFFSKDSAVTQLPDFLKRNLELLADQRALRNLAFRHGIPEGRVGKVVLFDPAQGWGLLRVPGRNRPLYVNAADLMPEDEQQGVQAGEGRGRRPFRYRALHVGQIVRFEVNPSSPRGPRAVRVSLLPGLSRRPILTV